MLKSGEAAKRCARFRFQLLLLSIRANERCILFCWSLDTAVFASARLVVLCFPLCLPRGLTPMHAFIMFSVLFCWRGQATGRPPAVPEGVS